MNREIVIGNWRQLKGKCLEQWGEWFDDGFMVLAGRQEHWAGQMMEAQGIARFDTQRKVRHAR